MKEVRTAKQTEGKEKEAVKVSVEEEEKKEEGINSAPVINEGVKAVIDYPLTFR